MKGTWIVVMECHLSAFKEPNYIDSFLIPYQKNNKSMQRHARTAKQSLHLMKHGSVNDYHDVLLEESLADVQLKSFNFSGYHVGLLFLYSKNDGYREPSITNEYSSPKTFDYKMIESTVLYHWFNNSNFLKFLIRYLDTVQKVLPTQGFGSR